MPENNQEKKRISTLISLIIAGETVFFLPFVLARIFRPTLLALFEISNTELGNYFFMYGIVAMASYVFGGTLADRFSARKLMSIALWLTSLGGFIMAGIPGSRIMIALYAFWGITTILLFWAAMIRATREWGGSDFQGRAFGWLEGGRGGTAAILGTIAFIIFSWNTPESSNDAIARDGIHALQIVILAISGITFLSGILIWVLVPETVSNSAGGKFLVGFKRVLKTIRNPTIWMLAIMIVCAYVGYKITDDFSLYARDVLGFSEVSAAGFSTAALWVRALVAVFAGYMADRLNHMKVIIFCYAVTVGGGIITGVGLFNQLAGLAILNLSLTAVGIYGVRALYFSILREANIPFSFTGTAVGIVSFIGFTPDAFMSPWMGHLLDKYPGETGHQYVFLLLALFAFLGLLVSILFNYSKNPQPLSPSGSSRSRIATLHPKNEREEPGIRPE